MFADVDVRNGQNAKGRGRGRELRRERGLDEGVEGDDEIEGQEKS